MNPELTLWDYIGLGLALLFVLVFFILRIKQSLNTPAGSHCGGCSHGDDGCSSAVCNDATAGKSFEDARRDV